MFITPIGFSQNTSSIDFGGLGLNGKKSTIFTTNKTKELDKEQLTIPKPKTLLKEATPGLLSKLWGKLPKLETAIVNRTNAINPSALESLDLSTQDAKNRRQNLLSESLSAATSSENPKNLKPVVEQGKRSSSDSYQASLVLEEAPSRSIPIIREPKTELTEQNFSDELTKMKAELEATMNERRRLRQDRLGTHNLSSSPPNNIRRHSTGSLSSLLSTNELFPPSQPGESPSKDLSWVKWKNSSSGGNSRPSSSEGIPSSQRQNLLSWGPNKIGIALSPEDHNQESSAQRSSSFEFPSFTQALKPEDLSSPRPTKTPPPVELPKTSAYTGVGSTSLSEVMEKTIKDKNAELAKLPRSVANDRARIYADAIPGAQIVERRSGFLRKKRSELVLSRNQQ